MTTMPAVIPEPALRRALLLADRLAGRHFSIAEIQDDPALQDTILDTERSVARFLGEGAELQATAIEEALWVIIDQRQAIRTLASPNPNGPSVIRYTVARPGEAYPELVERHAQDLILNHPAVYMAGGFQDHMSAPCTGDDRRSLRWNGALFALADAKLRVAWYPHGLPSLWNPLQGAELEHFQGYAAALRERAGEYATYAAQGPRRLQRELAASRLPCRPDRDPHPFPQSGSPTPLPTYPLLWMPLGDRGHPSALYLLHSRIDPVTNQDERIIGVAALTVELLTTSHLFRQEPVLHLCCPEVNGWFMPTGAGRVRFHLRPGPLPAIPTVRRRPQQEDGPETTPLRPLGWLSPATIWLASAARRPCPGLLLWGDNTGPRAWEEVAQDQVAQVIDEGRSWTRHLDCLARANGFVPDQEPDGLIRAVSEAPEEVVREALAGVLPYCMSDRLQLI
jgi:hypothetical protein